MCILSMYLKAVSAILMAFLFFHFGKGILILENKKNWVTFES